MGKNKTITPMRPSRLEQFSLGFEYDKTLQQVKHDMQTRTLK